MAKTNPRSARIAAVIQRVIATALSTGLHDPRLKSVTVTEVRVTNDMQIARIFWTQLGDPGHAQGERKRAAQALRQATGHLRTLVGRSTGLRLTPQLEFVYDEDGELAGYEVPHYMLEAELAEDEPQLEIDEQVDILSTWDAMKAIIKAGTVDPTNPVGGFL